MLKFLAYLHKSFRGAESDYEFYKNTLITPGQVWWAETLYFSWEYWNWEAEGVTVS